MTESYFIDNRLIGTKPGSPFFIMREKNCLVD